MGYRKFSELRDMKRGTVKIVEPTRQQQVEFARALDDSDIRSMIDKGEPLFSQVLRIYDWNKVQRALHNPNRRRKKRDVQVL